VAVTAATDHAPPIDGMKVFGFMNRVMTDMSGAVTSIMCTLGDRLGLFKELARNGPATSHELAERAGIDARYAREWLSALASAGYLEYDPETERFVLPEEHVMALAAEGSPMFMGGAFQQLPGLFGPLDELTRVFRDGGGIPAERYSHDLYSGMERISAGWFEHLLVQQWLEAVPDVRERLERGADVADVGCGSGVALLTLARAFPESRFVGFDVFPASLERARARADDAGLNGRLRFEEHDVLEGLPGRYDLVTAFDVLHDLPEPVRVLEGIRTALGPEGVFLLLEINCSDRLEENTGPFASILYGTSVLFCTPTSLAAGGDGLGTMGLPEPKARALCEQAGFSRFRRLPVDNPFNVLYDVRP